MHETNSVMSSTIYADGGIPFSEDIIVATCKNYVMRTIDYVDIVVKSSK